jgi:hypothetical protein
MGNTGLELASGAQVGPDCLVLLACDALRSAQVRSNCYQNCYQARAFRGAGDDRSHAYCSSEAGTQRIGTRALASMCEARAR